LLRILKGAGAGIANCSGALLTTNKPHPTVDILFLRPTQGLGAGGNEEFLPFFFCYVEVVSLNHSRDEHQHPLAFFPFFLLLLPVRILPQSGDTSFPLSVPPPPDPGSLCGESQPSLPSFFSGFAALFWIASPLGWMKRTQSRSFRKQRGLPLVFLPLYKN